MPLKSQPCTWAQILFPVKFNTGFGYNENNARDKKKKQGEIMWIQDDNVRGSIFFVSLILHFYTVMYLSKQIQL